MQPPEDEDDSWVKKHPIFFHRLVSWDANSDPNDPIETRSYKRNVYWLRSLSEFCQLQLSDNSSMSPFSQKAFKQEKKTEEQIFLD